MKNMRHIPGIDGYAADASGNIWSLRSWRGKDKRIITPCKAAENGRKATANMLADGRLTRRANGTFQYRKLGEAA